MTAEHAKEELAAAYQMELRGLRREQADAQRDALRELAALRQGQGMGAGLKATQVLNRVTGHADASVERLIDAHLRAGDRDADDISLRIQTQFLAFAFRSAPGVALFHGRGIAVGGAMRAVAQHEAEWRSRQSQIGSELRDRVLVKRSALASQPTHPQPAPAGWPSKYSLLELLGTGGFARVYSARAADGTVVAVKLMDGDDEARRRALREVDALTQLSHENVISLLDSAEDGSWLVMPRAVVTLGGAAALGRIDGARLVTLVTEVAAGLAHAHERGFIHRDLAPENILSLDSVWVLADWGLAKLPPGTAHSAMTKSGLGTAPWAAPEVLSDPANADLRADIFSLGRIVGWLVTEEVPEVNRPTRMPDEHAWREFVRRSTADARDNRPSDIAHLLALVPKNTALT